MLEFLELTRPQLGRPNARSARLRTRTEVTPNVAFPLPLMAYDLPWCERPTEIAHYVADNLDGLGIAVAGLRSEFHHTSNNEDEVPSLPPLSICPYRPERYGLHLEDLTAARIIDIRLAAHRDDRGLPRYSAPTMRRWDQRVARMADRAMQSFGEIESLLWPPDVADTSKLAGKVSQLKTLAPSAAISISIDASRVSADLPTILESAPDMVALRADSWPDNQGRALAGVVQFAADTCRSHAAVNPRLAVVPPADLNELDVVKLLALGADFVAVDPWCTDLLRPNKQRQSAAEWAAANLGVITNAQEIPSEDIDLTFLVNRIEKVRQWCESVGINATSELSRQFIATFDGELPGVRSIAPHPSKSD